MDWFSSLACRIANSAKFGAELQIQFSGDLFPLECGKARTDKLFYKSSLSLFYEY